MKFIKKILAIMMEKLLMISGFATSLIILLIVIFLFKEGAGLFNSPDVEDGYVIAVNRENPVSKLSPNDILNVFDAEIVNWSQVGGREEDILVFHLSDLTNYVSEEELGADFENIPQCLSKVVAEARGENYADLWGDDSRHYYVHGKDSIPFHTIILPSLMPANGGEWKLPDDIISSEYLTLEGRKISTSQNWAIWVKDIIDRYNPDSIRYFMIANGPERRDSDFSWREFVNSHNGELLGAYGNFVNRTLAFIYKYFDAAVPSGVLDEGIEAKIAELYTIVGTLIENGNLKEAIDTVFEFVRFGNKYFDTEKPWETRQADIAACNNTLFNCVQIIANLAVLLEPFLPFSSEKVKAWLKIDGGWSVKQIAASFVVPQPDILFERLDKSVVDEELQRLQSGNNS